MQPDDVEVVVKNVRGVTMSRKDSGTVSDLMVSLVQLAPHSVLLLPQHLPPSWGGPSSWRSARGAREGLPSGR